MNLIKIKPDLGGFIPSGQGQCCTNNKHVMKQNYIFVYYLLFSTLISDHVPWGTILLHWQICTNCAPSKQIQTCHTQNQQPQWNPKLLSLLKYILVNCIQSIRLLHIVTTSNDYLDSSADLNINNSQLTGFSGCSGCLILHCVSKNVPTLKLSVTLSNLNRF